MRHLMDEAIDILRHIPSERQDDIARAVMQLTGKEQRLYILSKEEEAEIAEADAEIERGEFATDAEMQGIWAKHTL